MKGLSLK